MNHRQICEFLDAGKPKRKVKRTLTISIIVILCSCFLVTGAILQSFGTVTSEIQVLDVILIDDLSIPTIQDNLSIQACSSINVTHNITNLHTSKYIVIKLNLTTVTEGLSLVFWENSTILSNGVLTIPPNRTIDVVFNYFVECNVDPNQPLMGTVEIEFVEAY